LIITVQRFYHLSYLDFVFFAGFLQPSVMLVQLRLPKTLLWVLNLLVIFLLMFTMYRLITFVAFKPKGSLVSDYLPSFLLGVRFDLRWISMMLLPVVITSFFRRLSPFYSLRSKRWWTWYLAIATFVIFFFFAADFGCFSYNNTRLNASALNFAEDPRISAVMLWQSYPIVWMIAGLIMCVLLLQLMFQRLHDKVVVKTNARMGKDERKWLIATTLALTLFVYGGAARQPLKWNAAFRYNDSFKSYLALNPLQNFFTTLKFRQPQFNTKDVKQYFPQITALLGLPNHYSFRRVVAPDKHSIKGNPNVVLVLCESFSMYKSSLSGNALNTTPYIKSLADSGIFFNRCFTPHFSTARGLFATLTGIPDVQLSKFSSRNPEALDQHTIINNFQNYNKYYFLGGSASFNNFEGLIKNIEGVHQLTEGSFRSKPVNVWGISDKSLFEEANRVFCNETKPFFAIIQTADNHRPFTIPEADADFKIENVADQVLNKWGFESVEEYNAFRYFDYCVAHFMEAAKKESYFENTIFAFVGDHGVSGNAKSIYPNVWTDERLTEEHVPLVFYAPKYLQAQTKTQTVSQIDVLPTLAGLAGQTYVNTTLGRDVLSGSHQNDFAFTIAHDEGKLGMITDDFYFTKNLNFSGEELHLLKGNKFSQVQLDSAKKQMSAATTAFYETAKYMLVHNKKRKGDG
jgi:phosphoglycerol transferase MdoB-like AlkP superfamily enzyme